MDVLARVIPFFLLIAAGVGAGRTRLLDLSGARALSAYVFWIAFPALLIHALSTSPPPDAAMGAGIAAYTLAAIAPILVITLGGRFWGWSREARAGAAMGAIGGNTAFLGAPVAISLFGAAAAVPAAAIITIDCTVIMAIATATLRSAAGEGGVRRIVLMTVQNPLVISAIVGATMMFAQVQAPGPVHEALGVLRATASPVGLVALGVVVGLEFGRPAPGETAPVLAAAACKLLLVPLLVWFAVSLSGADPMFRAVATLLAACPTAVNVFIQTRTYGIFARGGAMIVVVATIAAVVTLPLVGGFLEASLR